MGLQPVGHALTNFLVGAITAVVSLTAVLAITGALLIRLLNIDPVPYQISLARLISGGRVVSFAESIPARLGDNLAVQRIDRVDTDGDGFREWLVFYKFETGSGRAPTLGVIYDSDRGNPPVIFPYILRAPDRDYLSESTVTFQQVEITNIFNDNVPELLIQSPNELTIFRHNPNSADWDFPRDEWPRYEVIGFFRGSGGVQFNEETKDVTVIDRGRFERSQLAVKTVYRLNEATGTYLQLGASATAATINSPAASTIDFAFGPPADILETAFPEKIVLAFYQALATDGPGWNPADFVVPNSQAAKELSRNFLSYFGFPNNSQEISKLSVTSLSYFPAEERVDPRDTVLGEIPQRIVVQVAFIATQNNQNVFSTATGQSSTQPQLISYEVVVHDGKWKIVRRVDVGPGSTSTLTQPASCPPLNVNFDLGKAPIVNRTITLQGGQSPAATGIREFRWDFGDGQTGIGSVVTHQYAASGDYSITLTVIDNNNCSGSRTIRVLVP